MQTAIVAFSIVWCLVVLHFMYRMWKAHKLRIAVMKEDLDRYMRLPPYGEMVFKFWRPFSYFSEPTGGHTPEEESASPDTAPVELKKTSTPPSSGPCPY